MTDEMSLLLHSTSQSVLENIDLSQSSQPLGGTTSHRSNVGTTLADALLFQILNFNPYPSYVCNRTKYQKNHAALPDVSFVV
jgi:hypothetical protein